MLKLLRPTTRFSTAPSAQYSSSTGRWQAAKASSSSPKRPAAATIKPASATDRASSPTNDKVQSRPTESTETALKSKPIRSPAQSSAFFVQRARKLQAVKERQREANLIVVPIATGKEVQYATREEYAAAKMAEDELKKGRVRRAANLFDEGKLPEELRSLVGGRKKPFALSTVRRYLLDHAVGDEAFRDLLDLNWGRFTYGGGEYSDAPDLKEALRRVRVERGQEAEYRPPVTKPKTDKWQRK